MPYKINISESRGKTWKLEVSDESLAGKTLGQSFDGKDLKPELEGYEFEITGGSDSAGFPLMKSAEGIGLKRVLLIRGWGMHDTRKGVRLRKTVRGNQISLTTAQINLNTVKIGKKPLSEIFSDQNKNKEKPPVTGEPAVVDQSV